MKLILSALIFCFVLVFQMSCAEARGRHHHHVRHRHHAHAVRHHHHRHHHVRRHRSYEDYVPQAIHAYSVGHRPRAWCGWWMQVSTGVTSAMTHRNLNMAVEWSRVGSPTEPSDGAIVVWRHHVGRIVSMLGHGHAVVVSGNDGHRVRTRLRSLRGAIAFRRI
jgi:hypothetical protein